ncbi:MAG: hypothetical protein LC749_14285 [Actinobacteria bacterium]|nr:hypothetical protein [Actinomycetota bacterium]
MADEIRDRASALVVWIGLQEAMTAIMAEDSTATCSTRGKHNPDWIAVRPRPQHVRRERCPEYKLGTNRAT